MIKFPASLALMGAVGLTGVVFSPAQAAEDLQVRVVNVPPAPPAASVPAGTAKTGTFYVANRAPLQPSPFQKLPPGAIVPRGWLRRQLQLDAEGLVGRLPEISDYLQYEGNGWVDPKTNTGWEELPYWLRGYTDLSIVLHDPKMLALTKKWIDGILSNQKPDGYFGPDKLRTAENGMPDLWPHMPVLDALHAYYDYSGDARILPFMTRYFRWQNTLPPGAYKNGWGALRWADNMAVIYWLYNHTGDTFLLDLAKNIHTNSVNYVDNVPTGHNVNIAQGIREPAEYWMQSGDPRLLQATENDYQTIMGQYGQVPGGGFGGDENVRRGFGDPRQGFETCGYVEYMHTFEMMSRIAGNPLWADRTEEIAFNSLPATLDPDHVGIHYVTAPNLVEINRGGTQGQFDNKFPMLTYEPGIHNYRCCPHNYGMGWPYYAEELWLATGDKGVCASLYSASEASVKVGDGTTVKWTETTDYPFSDTIKLQLAAPKAVKFPLYLRIPRWTQGAKITVNGQPVAVQARPLSYIALDRTWKNGDVVQLQLPMQLKVRQWTKNKDAVSVDYGPLTFSLDVPENWSRIGGTPTWPEYGVKTNGAWNYGLQLDATQPTRGIQVVRRPGPVSTQPFTPATAPIQLKVNARRVPGWGVDNQGIVDTLRQSPALSREPLETVTLIPMGAARLRVTEFPTVSAAPGATDWAALAKAERAVQPSASHVNDSLTALKDGLEPKDSNDQGIPRFTWWDHKGTTEWIQYDFAEPRRLNAVSLYWFDDTGKGQCRVPASWRLLYKDGNQWKPIANLSPYGTARDAYNRVTFAPLTASALRAEVQLQNGVSGGVLEWKLEDAK